MVNFSVFNELSLPLDDIKEFEEFFKVLNEAKELGLNKIRMDKRFTEYPEILSEQTFGQMMGNISDQNKKRKLSIFVATRTTIIETPLIQSSEKEQIDIKEMTDYFYNGEPTDGGLACCDIWNTLAVSFGSHSQWNKDNINIQKCVLDENAEISERPILIKHASKEEHLSSHEGLFKALEEENKLKITQDNFWAKRNEFFPAKIIFCEEVKRQIEIKQLDVITFKHAINILRDIELERRPINQLTVSGEGETVKTDPKLRSKREFSISGKKEFFEKHIKNFPNNKHRIHFLERDNKIYIGYIGKHLPTKKDK